MKSKQNILQEVTFDFVIDKINIILNNFIFNKAVLLIRGLQKQENQLQTLLSLEMKKNADLKFHLKELI